MNTTYTSTSLRDRDNAIHDKYQSQIRELEAKVERLKHQNDKHLKTIFDYRNTGQRLAQSLGYSDVLEAQVAIDSADYPMTLLEAFKRLEEVEAQLAVYKADTEEIRAKLKGAEEKRKETELENRKLVKEHAQLQKQYDALVVIRERATKRYQSDFKNWKKTYRLHHPEDIRSRQYEYEPGISLEEQQRRMLLIDEHRTRLRKMIADRKDAIDSPRVKKEDEHDKENQNTPVATTRKRRFGSESPTPSKAAQALPLRKSLLSTVTNMTAPSASPTVFNVHRSANIPTTPLAAQPMPDAIQVKPEPSSSPINLNRSSSPSIEPHIQASSETEDDSQAIPIEKTNSRTGEITITKIPAPTPIAGSSRVSGFGTDFVQAIRTIEPFQLHRESERPNKLRRLSENSHELRREPSALTDVSRISHSDPRPSSKEKAKESDNAIVTPLTTRNRGQKHLEDYSAFKGRGRYSKPTEGPQDTSINALYEIDPAQNAGKNFQYDEVVRNRDERRKLNAGDCECCREYYENVGPLPSRLKQPLWRSPPNTPVKPCPRHSHLSSSPEEHRRRAHSPSNVSGSVLRQSDIDSHKKAISRHRHNWDRAATPPAYWDIGFPSTQEASDINKKAKEMHERKKDKIAKEAAVEGGRYRRK
ncbi:hypothetical protein JR316_0011871 [Psilocybe cubensis]|uniref:Uncharacterized protein n=2 Tax=Psilocybe cubensis TaxID=181762 RepID=A0ACB8GLM7_PSICU|nr:hypothetical protein JR316_0011871 [Psilocybe cubensis]KAH9476297.1 hypothetical protein JR316_0011871 [Psilocybe cubensis]